MSEPGNQRPNDPRDPADQPLTGAADAADEASRSDGASADGREAAFAELESAAGQVPETPAAPEGDTVEQLRADAEQWQQRALRAQAELENYRKRVLREMQDERRYASLPLMRDLLSVVDNLARAIESAERHENATGLLEGVKMVAEQLTGVLQRHHCQPISAAGAPFDPHLHEAIAQHPSDEHEPGHVTLVTQVGYQLHDRVVRPSQVIVAAPRPES